ncbi:hypothetical protein B0H14DRAFT_2602480 [Mycena olivaceomarginata]|nr:hypothetical protein B0H14DRAFT_2602480 [Mycena olivaceomarginata]
MPEVPFSLQAVIHWVGGASGTSRGLRVVVVEERNVLFASFRNSDICRNDKLSLFSIKLTNFLIPKRSNEVTKMPTEKAPLVFHKWARKYGNYAAPILIYSFKDSCLILILGDILYLELPGQSIVVLESLGRRGPADVPRDEALCVADFELHTAVITILRETGFDAALTFDACSVTSLGLGGVEDTKFNLVQRQFASICVNQTASHASQRQFASTFSVNFAPFSVNPGPCSVSLRLTAFGTQRSKTFSVVNGDEDEKVR